MIHSIIMNDNNNNNDNQELGALWKREARNSGMKYLAGHIKAKDVKKALEQASGEGEDELLRVVVFFNSDKRSEKSPDYRIMVSKSNYQKREEPQEEVTQKEELNDVEEDVLA